jgi:hypothetical protein
MYSPIIGLGIAILVYINYRRSTKSVKPLSLFWYFPVVVLTGVIAYLIGKYAGIWIACSLPEEPGNLCGLYGYLVTGPAACTMAMILAALLTVWHAQHPGRDANPA